MKNIFCLLLAAFAVTVAGNELAIGSNDMGKLAASCLKKGDVITTIGGIVGKVVMVNPNTIVIETSDDRVRLELTKWAVSQAGVQTGEQPAAEKKDKKAEKKEETPAVEAPKAEETPAEEKKN